MARHTPRTQRALALGGLAIALFPLNATAIFENPPPRTEGQFEPAAPMVPWCPKPVAAVPSGFDRVDLGTGEVTEAVVDMTVPGRGPSFVWARKYRSKCGIPTVMGENWMHSYDIRLVQNGPNLILVNGWNRAVDYQAVGPQVWHAQGYFRELVQNPDNSYTLVFPDQGQWHLASLGSPEQGKILAIIDRNNNALNFNYNPSGQLDLIVDTLGRQYNINYNSDGLIDNLTDFTGRQVTYEYYDNGDSGGAAGDLKSVTTPQVVGTPHGNDFPSGRTTVYTYSTGFVDPALNHNLLTITDPLGQTTLVNEYYATTNPSDLEFDRVQRQTLGDAGDLIDFVYLPETPVPANEFAVIRTIVNDREGYVEEWLYDGLNQPVIRQEYTGVANPDLATTDVVNRPGAPLRPGDPVLFETRWIYGPEFVPEVIVHPNGNQEIFNYDFINPDRRMQGNLMAHTRDPFILGGDQLVIVEQFQYEPGFGSCCRDDFVTQHTDGRGNDTFHTYDGAGNRTHTTHRIPSIVEDWEYNAFGQVTAHILPDNGSGHRRRDEFTYYGPGPQEGYQSGFIVDATVTASTQSFVYDPYGNELSRTDGEGNTSTREYNQLGELIRELSPAIANAGGVQYETLHYYDANGNVVRVDEQNADDSGIVAGNTHVTRIYEYDILGELTDSATETGVAQLATSVLDIASIPAPVAGEFSYVEMEYDDNRNRTIVRFGEATNGTQPTNTISWEYDERDLVYREIRAASDPDESVTEFSYDGNRNVAEETFGANSASPTTTAFVYDGYDRLTSSTDAMGNQEIFNYDANSNAVREHTLGEQTDVAGGAGNVRLLDVHRVFDDMDRLTRQDIDHFDVTTQVVIGDGQNTSTFAYAATSDVTLLTNDSGSTLALVYDTVTRPSVVTDNLGNTITYTYDDNDNVTQRVESDTSTAGSPAQVFTTGFTYDELDRVVTETDSAGNVIAFDYDARDHIVLRTDASGDETRFGFDSLGRLVSETRDMDGDGASATDGDDLTIWQAFDDSSRVTSRTDGEGNVTTYTYDALDRLVRRDHADTTAHTFDYDGHDRLVSRTDANSTTTTFTYDGLDRLTAQVHAHGPGVDTGNAGDMFEYDGLDRLRRALDEDADATFSYDSLGNAVSQALNGFATTATHDAIGNATSMVYPGGRSLTFTYDGLDRLRTIFDPGLGVTLTTEDYHGRERRLERRTLGNGIEIDFTYDGIDGIPNAPGDFGSRRVARMTHTRQVGGVIIDDRSTAYDPNQNMIQRNDERVSGPQRDHAYTYDAYDRLTRAIVTDTGGPVRDEQYTLDFASNLQVVTGGNSPGAYTADANDAPVNQYSDTPIGTREYDANGNLTRAGNPCPGDGNGDGMVDLADLNLVLFNFGNTGAPGIPGDLNGDGNVDLTDLNLVLFNFGNICGSRLFTYDAQNRLVAFDDASAGVSATYEYDPIGRRITKTVDDNSVIDTTRYYYDGWRVVEERDGAGATQATYVYGAAIDDVISMQRGGANFYYHQDATFSVYALTNAAGFVVERYEYGDYGQPLDASTAAPVSGAPSGVGNLYGFTGRRYDAESGLYYYRHRYLDPVTGRFTTRDPIGQWTDRRNVGNAFGYCGNNPWSFTDPFGLKTVKGTPDKSTGTACAWKIVSIEVVNETRGIGDRLRVVWERKIKDVKHTFPDECDETTQKHDRVQRVTKFVKGPIITAGAVSPLTISPASLGKLLVEVAAQAVVDAVSKSTLLLDKGQVAELTRAPSDKEAKAGLKRNGFHDDDPTQSTCSGGSIHVGGAFLLLTCLGAGRLGRRRSLGQG